MNGGFQPLDYGIFIGYVILIVALGLFISRNKKGHERDSKDYFLAGGTLSWWAIGASLIAANISAEQFIGMSGSGFAIGLAIAAYEWLAAAALIIVAKFILPVMLEKKIYTMPQLARDRYGKGVAFFFSFFWLLVYVFVNLTSVSWLGAIAMEQILGIPKMYGVVGLLVFAGIYSIYGGLKAVAWTDVLQVVFLVGGGLITAWFALAAISDTGSAFDGFKIIYEKVASNPNDLHFNLIIDKLKGPDHFMDLPGVAVILGAMWLTNLGYWGFNQYIIQKGLAAKNLKEAKRGLLFGAYLKILIPFIVVIPGIAAYVIFTHRAEFSDVLVNLTGEINVSDDAYPWLLRNFAPTGIRGLAFAALVAAVVSSLASMLNSTSTIFTMDIYKEVINKNATERQLVKVGRLSAFVALVIAMFTAKPLLGGLDQAFQYIQEFTGFIYPGVVVVFGMGILWKRASNRAALWTTIATLPTSIILKFVASDVPFQLRMGYTCVILISMAVILTLTDTHRTPATPISDQRKATFKKAGLILGILAGIAAVVTLVFGTSLFGHDLRYLGYQSTILLVFLFGFLSLMMYNNATYPTQDNNAFEVEPELFKTDRTFFIGAMGIAVILIALYAYFW
jgi:solute:Na+ symporter, SSS family